MKTVSKLCVKVKVSSKKIKYNVPCVSKYNRHGVMSLLSTLGKKISRPASSSSNIMPWYNLMIGDKVTNYNYDEVTSIAEAVANNLKFVVCQSRNPKMAEVYDTPYRADRLYNTLCATIVSMAKGDADVTGWLDSSLKFQYVEPDGETVTLESTMKYGQLLDMLTGCVVR